MLQQHLIKNLDRAIGYIVSPLNGAEIIASDGKRLTHTAVIFKNGLILGGGAAANLMGNGTTVLDICDYARYRGFVEPNYSFPHEGQARERLEKEILAKMSDGAQIRHSKKDNYIFCSCWYWGFCSHLEEITQLGILLDEGLVRGSKEFLDLTEGIEEVAELSSDNIEALCEAAEPHARTARYYQGGNPLKGSHWRVLHAIQNRKENKEE